MSEQQEKKVSLVFEEEAERNLWERIVESTAPQVFTAISAALASGREAREVGDIAIRLALTAEAYADYLIAARRARSVKLSNAKAATDLVSEMFEEQRNRGEP